MGNFYEDIEKEMVRIFNRYTELQRKKHEYCPGISLYPSEIHAVECIGLAGPINVTELARMLGMTKGGVSKCVARLENLALVKRFKYVRNQKEVYLHLTDLGVLAFEGHNQYHRRMKEKLIEYGEGLRPEQQREIFRFLGLYLRQMWELDHRRSKGLNTSKGE